MHLLERLLMAVTVRMTPTAFVQWLAALSTEPFDSDCSMLQTLLGEQGMGPFGDAAGGLLQVAEWTPELLAEGFHVLEPDPLPEDFHSVGYTANDLNVFADEVQKRTNSNMNTLAIRQVAATAPTSRLKAFFLMNIHVRRFRRHSPPTVTSDPLRSAG